MELMLHGLCVISPPCHLVPWSPGPLVWYVEQTTETTVTVTVHVRTNFLAVLTITNETNVSRIQEPVLNQPHYGDYHGTGTSSSFPKTDRPPTLPLCKKPQLITDMRDDTQAR